MQRDSLGLGRQYEPCAGLCCCTSCLRRQAARICCHQSYNSCRSLLHKSLPCLNSQGTKADLLFVQSYPIFSIPQATVFIRHEHSNRHHHKTKKVQTRHSCMAELHHCSAVFCQLICNLSALAYSVMQFICCDRPAAKHQLSFEMQGPFAIRHLSYNLSTRS